MQFAMPGTGETGDRIGVVADDLTGACDTAAQFRLAGARVVVLLDPQDNEPLPEDWDVLVLTTGSRRALATVAAQRTREMVARLRAAGVDRLYIKVDSTLRGAPGGIVEAAAMEFGIPYVLVAPAFPAQNRTVVGGWVRRDDVAITDGMTRLGETAIASIGHIPLRAIRSSMTAIAISPGLLADSVALLLADSETDDDLWTLADYAVSTGLPLVAGSAGFARFIASYWCSDAITMAKDDDEDDEDSRWAERNGPVLVMVGTRNPATQAQLDNLTGDTYADEVVVVPVPPERAEDALPALRAALNTVPIVVAQLTVPVGATVTDEALTALAHVVARVAQERGDDLCGLVITGGATISAFCAEAEVTMLRVVDEVMPGVPCSVIVDGPLAGLPIVSKAGGFGGEDVFVMACVWLLSDPNDDDDNDDNEGDGDSDADATPE